MGQKFDLGLLARRFLDCSRMTPLARLPEAFMTPRLRNTFLVSFQCQRLATNGSSIDRSVCSSIAASGSLEADGGCTGRLR